MPIKTQAEKAAEFAALHAAPGCFLIPNPWDAGSARILAALGFKALTTTSAGFARSTGVRDYGVTRALVVEHARALCAATDLPVAADLEDGFGWKPEDCARTIGEGAAAGLVGGSLEDWTGDTKKPIYELEAAADRIRAAAEAARALPFKFMLVARAENYLRGNTDLKDTIKRLQTYQEAGADVLFAPGIHTAEELRTLCSSVDRPVNILRGPRESMMTVAEVGRLGVKRISVGNLLHSAAMTGFLAAAREMLEGTFSFSTGVVSGKELDQLLEAGAPK